MTNRLINLLLLAMVFGLLACDSPVSEKPEQLSSSALDISSSSNLVLSSSEVISSSSDAGSSSSFINLNDTIYGVNARNMFNVDNKCNQWEMNEIIDNNMGQSDWNDILDLNYDYQVGCTSGDSLVCWLDGRSQNFVIIKLTAEKHLDVNISFNNFQIFPLSINKQISKDLVITDSLVNAEYVSGDSLFRFALGKRSMNFSVEYKSQKLSLDIYKDTENSWHYKIGKLTGSGYIVPGRNTEESGGTVVWYISNTFKSDSTGKVTNYAIWRGQNSNTNRLFVNDTLRYVYWIHNLPFARVCSNWNGDQIRFH